MVANISPLEQRLLNGLRHVEPGVRKIVIMSKYERSELTAFAAERLIRAGGLEAE